jgi:hypothetical protein
MSRDGVNLKEGSQAMDTQKLLQKTHLPPILTQESMNVHNLLLLFHLPTRCTKGKNTLIDYSNPHVVISFEYLDIQRRKTIEKVVTEEIRTVVMFNVVRV